MLPNETAAGRNESVTIAKRSQSREIIGRFLHNGAAVFGLKKAQGMVFSALFPHVVTTCDPTHKDLLQTYLPPSAEHIFGTDDYGRDIFARVVYGCRTSLSIGLISVLFSCLIGVFVGAVSGC